MTLTKRYCLTDLQLEKLEKLEKLGGGASVSQMSHMGELRPLRPQNTGVGEGLGRQVQRREQERGYLLEGAPLPGGPVPLL